MFIITNCTDTGNYTPSKADTYEDAYAWMVECTAENIKKAYGYDIEEETGKKPDELSVDDVIDWAEDNLDGYIFSIDDEKSYVEYSDGSFNEMKIFDLTKI